MTKSKIQIVAEGIDLDTFDDKKLPSDTHIIRYTQEGEEIIDAVRAYTMVDIFDEYYDVLGKENPIHEIRSGFGYIKPKLYGKIKSDEKKGDS